MPLLEKGSDEKLKNLAAAERAGASTQAAQIALGTSWWNEASGQKGPLARGRPSRAQHTDTQAPIHVNAPALKRHHNPHRHGTTAHAAPPNAPAVAGVSGPPNAPNRLSPLPASTASLISCCPTASTPASST